MGRMVKRALILGIILGGLSVVIGVVALAAPRSSDKRAGQCIEPVDQRVAEGISPSGSRWTYDGTIKTNGSCERWLLGAEFAPFGPHEQGWGGGIDIEARGSLSPDFALMAHDLPGPSQRAISGITGSRMREVLVWLGNGEEIVIRPHLVPKALGQRFVWLRNLRYFVRFYPEGSHVTKVRVRDATGKVTFSGGGVFGSFESP